MDEKNGNRYWKERLACFDFEVTLHDWLIVIEDTLTHEVSYFHNDTYGLDEFIKRHDYIYAGFNNKHYDNYILKAVLNHYSPEDIKSVNDFIIKDKKNGWEYPFINRWVKLPPTTDLFMDLKGISLKEIEGNLELPIDETTVDFDIDRAWTQEEFDRMLFYCKRDVSATVALLKERMGYLEAKVFNGTREGLSEEESLYRTNGQLASIALGAVKKNFTDGRDIKFPNTVRWKNIPKEVIDFFGQVHNNTLSDEWLFKQKLNIRFLGLDWVISWGGIHASAQNKVYISKDGMIQLIVDVTSLYPSIMEKYNLTSRAIPVPQKFFDMKKERIKAKHEGNKKVAKNLKVPINTVYGISLQEFSDCYDPRNGRSVCVTGQLLMIDLCVELKLHCKTIIFTNVNTDGVAFYINENEMDVARDVMNEWQERVMLELEEDPIKRYFIKDVNNYVLEKEDGSLKLKGGYVKDYNPSFTHNSLSIVAKAIVDYLIHDIPVEDTIYSCKDVFKFQLISKSGSSYYRVTHEINGEDVDTQRINRIYATKDKHYGLVRKWQRVDVFAVEGNPNLRWYYTKKKKKAYKKKWLTDEKGDYFIRKSKIQNCPEHAVIDNKCQLSIDDIDLEWYTKVAKKRIHEFLYGSELQKRRKKKMENLKEVSTESLEKAKEEIKEEAKEETVKLTKPKKAKKKEEAQVSPEVLLYQKIYKLGEILAKKPYVTDGYNSQQGYEYVKSSYYRKVLGEACREVGLIFKFSIGNRLFTPLEKTKNMNLITIQGMITFIDPTTGAHEEYPIIAEGSDNMDKGIYKAETMAIKYFVLNNFLLPETQDEIDPESGVETHKASVPNTVNVTNREEAKEKVVNDNPPTIEFLSQMVKQIEEIQSMGFKDSKGNPYGEKLKTGLNHIIQTGEFGNVTKTKAVQWQLAIEEAYDKAESMKGE